MDAWATGYVLRSCLAHWKILRGGPTAGYLLWYIVFLAYRRGDVQSGCAGWQDVEDLTAAMFEHLAAAV